MGDRAWRNEAACVGADTDLFLSNDDDDQTKAFEYCHDCPVKLACRESALAQPGQCVGIWGGTTDKQRHAAMRARKRRLKKGTDV